MYFSEAALIKVNIELPATTRHAVLGNQNFCHMKPYPMDLSKIKQKSYKIITKRYLVELLHNSLECLRFSLRLNFYITV